MRLSKLRAEIYIGVIIAIGVFLILSQAIVSLVFSTYDLISFTRSRTTARQIAEEKIETTRSLDYDDIGVVGGIPAGIIEPTETIKRNGLNYTITTRVDNIDDAFDGKGAADSNPVDYKRVKIEVSWGGEGTISRAKNIALMTDVSSPTDFDSGGGVLNITVTNANGSPVPLAEVTVVASGLTPPVDTTLTTDIDGNLIIPGSLACDTCYEISATKTGYSIDKTYGSDEVTNPINPDVTVVEDQISNVNLSIDVLGNLTIYSTTSRTSGFSLFPNQQFILRGDKIIGTDDTGTLIYKYADIISTDAGGSITLEDMEWDSYNIIIPTGVGWDVSGTNPLQPIPLLPGEDQDISFSSEVGSTHRLLVAFRNGSLSPLATVAATLKDNFSSFEASGSAGLFADPDYGQAFFSNLAESTYTLYATISGYLEYTNNDIIVTDYTKEQVIFIEQ